jgi:hypothetical protein
MQGQRLTRREIVATLCHEVGKLETVGADQPAAIKITARKHQVPVEQVAELVGGRPQSQPDVAQDAVRR